MSPINRKKLENRVKCSRYLTIFLVLLLILAPTSAVTAQQPESPPGNSSPSGTPAVTPSVTPASAPFGLDTGNYTFAECSRADSAQIQAEIETIAAQVLDATTGALDFQTLVDRKWTELDTGAVFEEEVDRAIAQVKSEVPYLERLWSGWSADKAEAVAEQVATYTFESAGLNAAMEELATAIATGLVAEIEAMTVRSASSALLCLQAYVGDAYSATLFAVFQKEIDAHLTMDGITVPDSIEASPLEMRSTTMTGAGLIVASEIARRIGQSMGQKMASRLAGKVAGRVLGRLSATVIPYVGWAVGIGLIVWDLVEGADGALPQIREALISEEVQQSMRAEIADEIAAQVRNEALNLAGVLAGSLTDAWTTFCLEQDLLCRLTADSLPFRRILETTTLAQVESLAGLAAAWIQTRSENDLETALTTGAFAVAAEDPAAALQILTWSADPEITVAWARAAQATGDDNALARVAETEIYRVVPPGALPIEQLATFVTIDDNFMINKLISLEPGVLESLLIRLPVVQLTTIAENATTEELAWLANYLAMRQTGETATIVERLTTAELTIAGLQAQQTAVADNSTAGVSTSGAVTEPLAAGPAPLGGLRLPESWSQNADSQDAPIPWRAILQANSVLIAALLLLILAIGMGIALAVRQNLLSKSD